MKESLLSQFTVYVSFSITWGNMMIGIILIKGTCLMSHLIKNQLVNIYTAIAEDLSVVSTILEVHHQSV